MSRILFVLKRQAYGGYWSSGLFNSVKFVVDMLRQNGVLAHIAIVTDNNDIDREVTAFKPTHVIVEALWVVPDKFKILRQLHPSVKWIVRLHSDTAFLASESVAIQWIIDYLKQPNVFVASNSLSGVSDLEAIVKSFHIWRRNEKSILYLPNFYPNQDRQAFESEGKRLDVGCFGAIRPLKNQLAQGIAAIKYADAKNENLFFHINASRIENGGEPILKNLRDLFQSSGHTLVEHDWLSHESFLQLLRRMDISMQVSFSETFNIVTADAVASKIPIVSSPAIEWTSSLSQADPTDTDDMAYKIDIALSPFYRTLLLARNSFKLSKYSAFACKVWLERFK